MPAGATYEPIATASGNGTTATVTFSSISGSYTDLVIVANVLSTTSQYLRLRFNGDTGSNYSWTYLGGVGTVADTGRSSNQTNAFVGAPGIGFSSTIPMFSRISIFNYAGSTNKTLLSEVSFDNNGSGDVYRFVLS